MSVDTPKVMIVGAGIGGLFLGMLLESLGCPYHIYERATEHRALGSVLALGANVLPVFEQLGLLQQIEEISLPCYSMELYRHDMTLFKSIETDSVKETGYESLLFERPKLYDVLLKQIPSEKITMGKRVLKIEEKDDQVIIHCADNTSFEGDIVVGADGAYSSVRQSIYKRMENMGTLPKSDKDGHSIGSICTVGVAQLPDLEKYPSLQANRSSFAVTLGENLRSVTIVSFERA
ncbi:hypothetical protein BCR41DRAFT_388476 [Lobosporangium transversale]|uniref:FAD-binding domain-containing protein n=1 Tax=Lobosporangium transversale TaxID=64571 RepID=A0A1Y2GEJ5_9FUNG|nr:hypothetical protein BCR41DRAFT_388476 [Lobosporangium transversale]ORZ08744.1 hypothetical protein BCR41DRAFT_388476 [Lobosporangium transversale]|eukprot:XP_021878527.1 hypothetical protein BCR41DRAFT_388476 [Lobosporangium transversale]